MDSYGWWFSSSCNKTELPTEMTAVSESKVLQAVRVEVLAVPVQVIFILPLSCLVCNNTINTLQFTRDIHLYAVGIVG